MITRLLRIVLVTLAVLSLTFLPVSAATHRHCNVSGTSLPSAAAAHVHGHHSGAHQASSADPGASHHGKYCGMACCGPNACTPAITVTMAVRLYKARPRTLAVDDARRNDAVSGLSLRPPITA